uniref:GPS domain-containing protein n=2 Tax=Mesocestoides corti TaxID=53468 RepID=A0A5K3EGP3_MESCO
NIVLTFFGYSAVGSHNPGEVDNSTSVIEARKLRAAVVEKLVDATENLPMNDPNTFKLSISTLNSLSQTAVDMPQSAQIKLTKILQNASQVFDEISRFASREDSIHSGNSVLSMVLNILNGTTSQLDSPIATDVVTNSLDMNYDTDLEAMGVVGTTADDQYLLLSKEETRKHQEAASAALFVQLSQLQGNVAAAVSPILTADEVGISSVTPFGKIHMRKMRKSDVQNWLSTFYSSSSISSLTFNGLDAFFNDTQDVFAHTMITLPKMFAFADANPKSIPVQSETVGLSFYKDGKEVRVNEIPGVVTVKIIRDPTTLPPPFTMVSDIGMPQKLPEPLVAVDGSEIYQPLIMTGFDIEQEDVSFSFEIQPTNASTKPQYLVVARFVYPPDLTKLEDDWGLMWAFVPPSADIYDDLSATLEERERNLTFFIDNHDFKLFKKEALQRTKGQRLTQRDLNKLWVGFRQLNKQEVDQDWTEIPLPYANRDQINTTINYRGFVTTCEFLEKDSAKWDTKGCLVDRQTTAQAAVCVCNHLTTFAAGWIVVPNTVDFNYIFRNIQFEKNATLYVTEITVGIIFLLLFIWARRMDNKDIQKLGITPLAENNPADEYLYEIIVGTGMRRRAGTTSTVCMQLNGEKGGTPPFTLRDPHRKVLQRGNTDRFLLATAKPLGDLRFLRIWHDNTGQGSGGSWFCDFVITIDLQTKSKYTFLVEKWLAVDEDDGMVDRVIPVAGPLDRLRPYYLFSHKVTQDASDKHLWASVFTRPAYSRFTRVERVGCCLLVLFLTMVSSCMFYKAEGPAVVDFEFSIGPFALTPYVAFTGVVSCLITFVPVSVVMMLFRKSRLRVNHMTLLRDVVEEHLDEELDDNAYDTINEEPQQSYLEPPRYSSVFQNHSSLDVDQPPPYSENPEPPGKRLCEVKEENESKWKDFTLPWQTRILAWILLILGIVTSVVFTTFYGVTFGDAACKQWLSSLFLSFFLDLFLTQPAKVVLFALFFAVICKSKATAEDFDFAKEDTALMNTIGRRYRLNYGEEYLHDDLLRGKSDNYVVSPPDPETLERARVHRQNQRRMHGMLREILFFFLFFSLLIIVSNGFRDPMANRLRESLSSLFFSDDDFEKINSIDDLWDWIEKTLLPNLRASRWYNGHPPLDQRGFIGDRKNRIMGYATMRQVRIRQDSCAVQQEMGNIFSKCYGAYSIWTQDENDYLPGWIPSQQSRDTLPMEYRYTRASERGGSFLSGQLALYSGGGYVHELRGSSERLLEDVQKLRQQGWIDHRTRAVIVEFTTFNPGTHLFGMTVIKFELPGTGSVLPSYRIEPANLLSFTISGVKAFELTCQILFVIALAGLLIKEGRNLWGERLAYFRTFRSWAQMFILFGSFGAICIYVFVTIEVKKMTLEFYRTNGNGYANFQMVANWNEVLAYLVALITFVAILMFMHIFRFNKNIGLLGAVLSYAYRDMKYFFAVFAIIFFSFVVAFFLLFYDTMDAYCTFISSMETSFQIVLGKFDVKKMYEREPILGPVIFAAFSLFIIFIMLSMFVAILTDSFEVVRKDPALQSHDYELVHFMLARFILWSGFDRFKWAKRILNEYSLSVTEQIYDDDEEHECEKLIAELNDVTDRFVSCVKSSELVGVRDV